MVSRRKQTAQSMVERPVRFYKIVALTFLVLTVALLGVVVFMSSKRATITITTKKTPVDLNSDVVVGKENADGGIPGIVTTTIVHLEKTFSPTGNTQVPGIANGQVTLYNDSGSVQPLVATTRLLNQDNVLFRLKTGVTVPAKGSIDADVYADQEGAAGNIGPSTFTIPGLNAARQKEVYAKSAAAMSGGLKTSGVLTQKDIDDAKQMLAADMKQTAERQFRSLGDPDKGIVEVLDISAATNAEVGKEVNGFTLAGNADVLGVFYDAAALDAWVTKQLSTRAIDESEIVEPSEEKPTVSFAAFDQKENAVTLHVVSNATVTINPESKQIDKEMFYGKSKDELRRYLLSLDHVHAVDVEFKPAWIQTVPHVREHVTVIVKEVR